MNCIVGLTIVTSMHNGFLQWHLRYNLFQVSSAASGTDLSTLAPKYCVLEWYDFNIDARMVRLKYYCLKPPGNLLLSSLLK